MNILKMQINYFKIGFISIIINAHDISHSQNTNIQENINQSVNTIGLEREKTKAMIDNVNADKTGRLDNANSLGINLKSLPLKNNEYKYTDLNTQINNNNDNYFSPVVMGQWPELKAINDTKKIINPIPRGTLNDDGSHIFTPDFSRQKLTLGLLNKDPFIDLPDQELDVVNLESKAEKNNIYTLADLVYAGINYSPILEQAQYQLEISIARAKSSRADLFPKASIRYATGKENSNSESPLANQHITTSSAYRVTQPIFNLPIIREWMSELNNQDSVNWRMHSVKESISLSVVNAVINVSTNRMILDFADDQIKEFNKLFEYVQSRNQSGASSTADMERVRTRIMQSQQLRIEQQANYRNSLMEIKKLTGLLPSSIQLPYLNQLPGLPSMQSTLRTIVWENSYDLRALRKDIKAQEMNISSQYNKLLPTLSLNLERDDGQNIRGINARQIDDRVLAVLNWEVSLGGKEFYSANAAVKELKNRQARLDEEVEKIMQEIDTDYQLLQSATLRIATGQSEQQAAQIVVISVNEQLKNGRLNSVLEALDANEKYFNARQRLVQTLGQQIQAQAQLLRRIGVLNQITKSAGISIDTREGMSVNSNSMPPLNSISLKDKSEENINELRNIVPSNKPTEEVTVQKVKEKNISVKELNNQNKQPSNSMIKK